MYQTFEVSFKDGGFLSSCRENEVGNYRIEDDNYYRRQGMYNFDVMLIIVVKVKLPAL